MSRPIEWEPTARLRWRNGVLEQMWQVASWRASAVDNRYSRPEPEKVYFADKTEWRPVPTEP